MSIGEEQIECPLCMEPLELDDLNFFPCTCGYQICRFCWHRIRTDENGLCPACRKAYPEDPAEFKPLTEDEFSCHRLQRIKRERKMKDLQRKQKAAENRKHLANVRVVQKNLVFVVGLSQRLGDTEVLKKHDYFGKYGKIIKVVINQSTSYAGSQGPSASAYVTYLKPEDALRAIQAVNNIHVDGRTLKASLGTTKYCSHFLRGTQCPKSDCMYLHELGDEQASFTKEEMQQGKHQEYEQKLYEHYMNHLNNVNLSNQTNTQQTNKQGQTNRKKSHSPATTSESKSPPPSASQQDEDTDLWPSLQPGQGGKPPLDRGSTTHTHKRSASSDLQNRHTPDSSNRPSPQSDSCSTSSTSSSSNSSSSHPTQVSPTQTHTPPSHRPTCDTNITQGPPLSRKPLYGDSSQDSMSLFSSSGYPVTRNPSKPPHPAVTSTNLGALGSAFGDPANQHPTSTHGQHTEGLPQHEIPDTISVNSSTDWQAAFGFKPSPMTSHLMNNTNNSVSQLADTQDTATDDDLGFDPWNESTKALQDLIEKESAPPTANQQQNATTNHLPSSKNTQTLQQAHHMMAPERTKIPPGFTPNHISAFNHNPLLGGSRMMNLMKLQPQQEHPIPSGGLAMPPNGGTDPFSMKSWQEGLRALLPNINIHFGLPGGPPVQNQALPPHLQLPPTHQQQQLQTQMSSAPHKPHTQNHNSWDLSFDPAIVTSGQVTENNLMDEPHWMASLHHLTEEPTNQNIPNHTNNKFLPMGIGSSVPAPPPGFQNTIRPPPQLASTGLEPHKLMDGFQ